jgi:hypothetical protein
MGVAVAAPVRLGGNGGGRPGYWAVLRRVLVGQIAGSFCLFLITVVVSQTSLASVDVSGMSIYAPWLIDGPWALAACAGWGLLVVALVGSLVRAQVGERTAVTLSRGLTFAAVAIGGYGPTLFDLSTGARLLATVAVTSSLVLLLGFEPSGAARTLRGAVELSRRTLALILVATAVVLVAPFALLHPLRSFASMESGPLNSNASIEGLVYHLHAGGHFKIASAMKPAHMPITVTGVRFLGGGALLRVDRVTLTRNYPPWPFVTPAHRPLPLHLEAGQALWVGARLTLTRCTAPTVRVSAVTVSYRELGLSLHQTVGLDQAVTVAACRGPR